MFGIFSSDPAKKAEKQLKKLYPQAVSLQRNGKLREYADLMSEIEKLEKVANAQKEASA